MDSHAEREASEQLGSSAPRSPDLNKALGKAMTKREVELKLFGYSSIPENQEDEGLESSVVHNETLTVKIPRNS